MGAIENAAHAIVTANVTANERAQDQQHSDNKTLIRVTRAAVAGAWIYAAVAAFQYCAMVQANRETDRNFRASERPYVSIGNRDGTIAELSWTKDSKPTIRLYFFNAGRSPALNFTVSAMVWPEWQLPKHIERYKWTEGGQVHWNFSMGARDIPAESLDVETVYPSGQLPGYKFKDPNILGAQGTYEYCDEFGGWHCQAFMVQYDWSLERFFVAMNNACEDTHDTVPRNATILPRCEQPGEDLFPERKQMQRLNPRAFSNPAPR